MYTGGRLYDRVDADPATSKLELLSGPTLFDGIARRFDDGSMRTVSCVLAIVALMTDETDAITCPQNAAAASLSNRLRRRSL